MKIEKISDNKLRILITASDLRERDLDIEDLYRDNSKAHSLFWDIIYQAYLEESFDVDDSKLIIEVAPVSSDSFVVIVTRIPNNIISKKIMRENTALKNVYSFDAIEDLMNLSHRILGLFRGSSTLYKYKDKYVLVMFGYLTKKVQAIISEYGHKENTSEALLNEYGNKIIDKKAIETMCQYF
ncbi:adaptor protein MecA [Caldanaerobius polysaccharolyticus]|uniref:adaptor protein MecA n=1 Tax=Caldanaerobius polysaccharolyticus TaxID=44256 RepID=UPI000479198D|nr:adaptor protein MecA [Caldanaerobius polysaccharolyticus]